MKEVVRLLLTECYACGMQKLTLVVALVAVAGCRENTREVLGPRGEQGQPGEPGAKGAAGPAGNHGLSALVLTSAEGSGSNCASGGTKVSSGLDSDGNGILDTAEVSNVSYVCNGQAGTNAGATALDAGVVLAEHIADGAIIRGKLARESVLPENRGRGNSVRSFAHTFQGPTSGAPWSMYTVPAGKTFIVTDVVGFHFQTSLGHIEMRVGADIRAYIPSAYVTNGPSTSGYSTGTHLAAGIRFDAGEAITVTGSTINMWVTISGYEF